jgi:hypothetical protein
MKKNPADRFDCMIRVHATHELHRLVDVHARRHKLTASAWLRRVITEALQAEGTSAPPLKHEYKTPKFSRMIHREDHVAA